MESLEKGNPVKKTSQIYSLCLNLNKNEILRIGSRLKPFFRF